MVFVDSRCVDRYCLPPFTADIPTDGENRLIGFEELGDNDHFTTATLEFRLKQSGKPFILPNGPY